MKAPGKRAKDITGQTFGRLTVLEYAHYDAKHRRAMWSCQCACGAQVVVAGSSLRNGTTRSCGCLQPEATRDACTTHGLSGGRASTPRLYSIWRNMRHRCRNPRASKFHLYGGRGIRVCAEWASYPAFHEWALSSGYADDLTLDRIDCDGDYEPDNCHWVTAADQGRYTRHRRLITFRGETRSVTEWAEHLGMKPTVLSSRINGYRWPIQKALTTPVKERRS